MTMNMTTRLLAATFCVSVSPAAFAQDRLDTVIVTTAGPDRSADELIGKATSLQRDDIVENLAGSLGDTLDKQPGVSSTFFGAGASRPILRGLGAERVLVLTNGIGVIDVSAASPDHQVATDGIDAERIEILRGPAALAYGGQAIGGVVNVIDGLIVEDLPDEPFSVDLFTAYNSVNEGTELAGRGQFTAGDFVFTLSGSQRDFDNYDIPGFAESSLLHALEEAEEDHEGEEEDHEEEEARDTVENSFVETQALSAGVSWVGDNAFFGVAVRQQTAEYGLPGHGEHGHDEEEGEEEEENPFIDLKQTRYDVRGGIEIDNSVLTKISASLSVADYEHIEFEGPGEPGTVFESNGTEGRVEFDHELGGFKGAAGLQYLAKDIAAFGDEAFITPTDTDGFGVFLFETREWDDGFGIEGGLRADTVKLDNVIAGEAEFDLFSGSFGGHKHWQSGWFVGAQVGYTERAPNETELFADGPHLATNQYEVGDRSLGKESGLNLEGSVRWLGERSSVGVNLFSAQFSDFVYLAPGQGLDQGVLVDTIDGLPVFVFTQDDADFVGGEIYGELEIAEGLAGADWALEASLDFVEATLDAGGNVPFIPPLTLNVGAEAQWQAWQIGADISVAADQSDAGAGQLPTDGYTRLDLRGAVNLDEFGIGGEGTQAFVEVRNVTDEEIRHATSVLKDQLPAPGRNLRIGLKTSF